MYEVVWTPAFTRAAKKFLQQHPEFQKRFVAILCDLEEDPFQPHLKYHPLGGNLKGIQAVSITYDYRTTFTLQVAEKEIILLDVGRHDEVYR